MIPLFIFLCTRIVFKEGQFKKTSQGQMFFTFWGMFIVCNEVQPSNAFEPMVTIDSGSLISCREVQPLNA